MDDEEPVSVRGAVSDALAALGREPALAPLVAIATLPLVVLVGLPTVTFRSPEMTPLTGYQYAAPLLVPVLAPPLLAGAYALLDEVLDGERFRVDAFVAGVLGHAWPIYRGTLAVVVGGGVLAFVAGALVWAIPVVAILLVVASPLVVLSLAYLLLFVQFVTVSVVVDGRAALSSLFRCRSLLHGHPLGVLWYTLLRAGVLALVVVAVYGGLAGPFGFAEWALAAPVDGTVVRIRAPTLGVLAALWLGSVVLAGTHVAYYRRLSGADSDDGEPDPEVGVSPGESKPPLGRSATAMDDEESS
jgi:hypothetical protein